MSWLDTLEEIRTRDFGKASPKDRDDAARKVVNLCSYAAAVVAISPVPFSDVLLMLPIQSAMVMTVGHIYGRRVDKASAKDLILELGTVAGVGVLARQGIKALLPVVGALLTVPAAFAANWGIGRVAMEYFKNPGAGEERLREIFEQAKREGSSLFSREAFDRFRKQNEEQIREVAQEEAQAPSQPTVSKAASAKKSPASRPVQKKPLGRKAAGSRSKAKKARSRSTVGKGPAAGKPEGPEQKKS